MNNKIRLHQLEEKKKVILQSMAILEAKLVRVDIDIASTKKALGMVDVVTADAGNTTKTAEKVVDTKPAKRRGRPKKGK